MNPLLTTFFQQTVNWKRTERAEFPYTAEVSGQTWKIRIDNFPEEKLYTLLIQDKEIGSFDDWPSLWLR